MPTPMHGPDRSIRPQGYEGPNPWEQKAIPVFDGHLLHYGNRIAGPALVEMVTTTAFISANYDAVTDQYGSLLMYRKGRDDLVRDCLGPQS